MSPDLGQEARNRQGGHSWEGPQTRLNLELNLVFEEARMLHHLMVENKLVGEAGTDEIEEVNADEGHDGEREELPWQIVARPC